MTQTDALERTMIVVDVGATKTAVAAVRARLPRPGAGASAVRAPVVLHQAVTPTDRSSPESCLAGLVSSIAAAVSELESLAAGAPEAIGIGTASMVDFAAGRIVESVNLPLRDVPLCDLLRERFGVPVVLDNDATAATIGEHEFGAGVGTRDMVMLTLGTGVGGGIIAGGRPYRGSSGAAAELGHVLVDVDGLPCPGNCPNHGCLEAYVSGTAMGAAALAEARAKPASALGRALRAGEAIDGPLLTRLAQEGDPGAAAVVTRIGEYLGAGLVTLVNALNPELVVIGGGAAAAGELLLAPARRVLAARALRPQRDEVRVVPARFGNDAGIVGAAALALSELF